MGLAWFAPPSGLIFKAGEALSGVSVTQESQNTTRSYQRRYCMTNGRRVQSENVNQHNVSRRSILHSAVSALLAVLSRPLSTMKGAEEQNMLEEAEYTGPLALGFKFIYPKAWTARKKPIKTHMYEVNVTNPDDSSTSVGVVVDAVKIDSIVDFGTPKQVGDKVIAVELKKDNVITADLIGYGKSEGVDGLVHYTVEYRVDSTRGSKHFVAKAAITGGQLYVLTAQTREGKFKDVEATLNRIVDTFQVQKQYT